MSERFDVEVVLRDALAVLRRHNIPIESAALQVSLLDAAFDEQIPRLKTYKAGHFHRPMVFDDVPMLFHAQRRYPFDEIVEALEHEFRPSIEAFAEALRQEYPALKISFISKRSTRAADSPRWHFLYAYRLGIDCQFADDSHADYNELDLTINLHQRDDTDYPRLDAWLGWLVDEESGGEWGIDVVHGTSFGQQDYTPRLLNFVRTWLPDRFKSFRQEIVRELAGEPVGSR